MSHVFPRHTKGRLPVVAGGEGCYLIDAEGKRYLDMCGGAAVSCLGHSAQPVIDAAKAQLDLIAWAHTSFFTSEPAEELATILAERAPGAIDRVYFLSGGSETTEAAIKLARQYHLERGETSRRHVVARWQSYHGNTLGALGAGGNRMRRAQFKPLLAENMYHIAPCHYWRWGEKAESAEAYGRRVADELDQTIRQLGADTVSAFIAETVVGATMGAVPPAPGYFERIRKICDEHGVVLILDEVMAGMGRTGRLFACEEDGIAPDIVCIAKGLGAGIQPIGAMLCTETIYRTIAEGSGFFQHGHTYVGHPVACAAARAVIGEIEAQDLLPRVREMGELLQTRLQEAFGQHWAVGDIRGRGLFRGIELVADRSSKAPFDPALNVAGRIKKAAFEAGLMIYPAGGTVDGQSGDHILLAPPFIVEEAHIEEMIDKLGSAMENVLEEARAA